MRLFILSWTCILVLPVYRLAAQAITEYPLQNYNEKTIYLQNNSTFIKNNVVHYGHKSLLREFSISPGGMDLYVRSRRNRNIGMTVSLLGTAGSLYALFNRNNVNWRPFFWGSLVTGAIAAPLNMKASRQLNQAVWLRNRDALLIPELP